MLAQAKTVAHRILPVPLYGGARDLWRITRKMRNLGAAVVIGSRLFVKYRQLPRVLLFFGVAPGDDVLCTTVLRELRKRSREPIWMISNYPELFYGNSDAAQVVALGPDYCQIARFWRREFCHLEYSQHDGKTDISSVPHRHIIAELCARAGATGRVAIRPRLILSDEEKAWGGWAKDHAVIQSSGLAGPFPMRNKQWYPERFQLVVERLQSEYEFIQLGSTADPKLERAKDLRGATSIRQSAAILHNARLYIGSVGFLMHLARSVDCPSVIIYGGREAPWQSGYICNINLYTPLPCAPCWQWNRCDFDRKCLNEITADDVIAGVSELAHRPRGPLAVQTIEI